MTAFRATVLAIASAPLALMAMPAQAQIDDAIVLDIMRQCARIDDATARLACYDNNVRVGNTSVARPSVPGAMPRPQSGAAIAPNNGATGFGREDVRGPERFEIPAGEIEELTARVRTVEQLNQGTYLLTLEDGAVWQFAETVDFAYRPPRAGSTISIDRAALGSFLMVFDSQRSVRVRRIR
jgi:hypothetical protein